MKIFLHDFLQEYKEMYTKNKFIWQRVFCIRAKFLLICIYFSFSAKSLYADAVQPVFNKNRLHTIAINITDSNWYSKLQQFYNAALNGSKQAYIPAQVILDNDTINNAGFRFKGKYSNFGFPGVKKPFRIDFNEFVKKQSYQGLKKLNLHNAAGDPSFLREYIAYDLYEYLGIAAPLCAFTKLYINNEYWGCYSIVEEPDKAFIKKHYSDATGNLFECIDDTELAWAGSEPKDYPEMELKTDSTSHSWDGMMKFIHTVNKNYTFDFSQLLASQFNIEEYMKILATDVWLNNWDSYHVNGRNFFLYEDLSSGKINWIPWDYNLSMWSKNMSVFPYTSNSSFHYAPLIFRTQSNEYLRDKYLKIFCHLLEYEFRNYPLQQRVNEAKSLIKEAVETDKNKFYTNNDFYLNSDQTVIVNMLRGGVPTDVTLPGITKLLKSRSNDLRAMLSAMGYNCADMKYEESGLQVSVFPNPVQEKLSIYISNEIACNTEADVVIYNMTGKNIFNKKMKMTYGSTQLDTGMLEPGMYIIAVHLANHSSINKFTKL